MHGTNAGLLAAMTWPMTLLQVSGIIDNPWNVCVARSVEVGHHLADLLLRRQHGRRPVTLVGFSLGARVIYHCLLEMSKRPDPYGIVEDVYLLGAPVTGSVSEWAQVCRVVGGRLVNGYSSSDWLLAFLYRTMSAQLFIAGTGPVTGAVNFDLTHIVKGHMDYRHKLRECLEAVGCPVTTHRTSSVWTSISEESSVLDDMSFSRRTSNARTHSLPSWSEHRPSVPMFTLYTAMRKSRSLNAINISSRPISRLVRRSSCD
jgi:pimeloyl-ACP methyl ester carboxylesterase